MAGLSDLFGRRTAPVPPTLPTDTAERMVMFGQFAFDPSRCNLDGEYVWRHLQSPYLELATADPAEFVSRLAAHVLPIGGWATYGAHRTVANLIGPETGHTDHDRIRDAALRFLRAEAVPYDRLDQYEQNFWDRHGGGPQEW